jgi:hypothetical protein
MGRRLSAVRRTPRFFADTPRAIRQSAFALIRWFITAALIALLLPAAAEAAPVACRVPLAARAATWKLKSFELESARSSLCSEMVAETRSTMRTLTPSRRAAKKLGTAELHVQIKDASTVREIRFEARAWAITEKGRHLRHVSRAVATAKHRSGSRNLAAKVARLALQRVLRELAAE